MTPLVKEYPKVETFEHLLRDCPLLDDTKGIHVRVSEATPPPFRTRDAKENPDDQVQGLRPARTRFDRRGRM